MDSFCRGCWILHRLLVLDGTHAENPSLSPQMRQMGFIKLPYILETAAVTFCDVVISHRPFSDGLLFHELVHVEQCRQLGIARYAWLYVSGFLFCGGYDGIPLELNTYQFGGKFESNPLTRFRWRMRSVHGSNRVGSEEPIDGSFGTWVRCCWPIPHGCEPFTARRTQLSVLFCHGPRHVSGLSNTSNASGPMFKLACKSILGNKLGERLPKAFLLNFSFLLTNVPEVKFWSPRVTRNIPRTKVGQKVPRGILSAIRECGF